MINLYCDESCHLINQTKGMVLGAVLAPLSTVRVHSMNIRAIKEKYGLPPFRELKWTGVSPAGLSVYKALIDYFFSCPDLAFRAVVIRDKTVLCHEKFGQTYDEWYYKMYYVLLKNVLSQRDQFRVYIDIKDTRGAKRVEKLMDILRVSIGDAAGEKICALQEIRSHEVQLMSVVDLLIGAVSYENRNLGTSAAKIALCEYLKKRAQVDLITTTSKEAAKVNILVWKPQC